ncbi:MAG: hypothetical protein AAF927_30465 [Bacteroidota bacterium]
MLVKVFFSYTQSDYRLAFRTTTNQATDRGSVIKKIFEIIKNNALGTYRYIFDFYSYKDKSNTQESYDIYLDKAKRCNAFVLFPSDSYFESKACSKELEAFLRESMYKKIYPLYMDKRARQIYIDNSRKRRSLFSKIEDIHRIELFNEECEAIYKDTTNDLLNEKLDEITDFLIKQADDLGTQIKQSIVIASNSKYQGHTQLIETVKTTFFEVPVFVTPLFTDEELLMAQEEDLIKKRKATSRF